MMSMQHRGLRSDLQECFSSVQSAITGHAQANHAIIKGKIVIDHSPGQSGPGKSASAQIFSCTKVDPGKFNSLHNIKLLLVTC